MEKAPLDTLKAEPRTELRARQVTGYSPLRRPTVFAI
jgi:hypothetical protein